MIIARSSLAHQYLLDYCSVMKGIIVKIMKRTRLSSILLWIAITLSCSHLAWSMEYNDPFMKKHSSTSRNPWHFHWERFISPNLVPEVHRHNPYLRDIHLYDDASHHMVPLLEIEPMPQEEFDPICVPQDEEAFVAQFLADSPSHGDKSYSGQSTVKNYHRPSNQDIFSSSSHEEPKSGNRHDIMTLILADLTVSPAENDLAKWELLTRQAKRHWDPTGSRTFAGFSNFLKDYLWYYLSSGEVHSKIKILSRIAASIYDAEERPINAKSKVKKRKRIEENQQDDKDSVPHSKKRKE